MVRPVQADAQPSLAELRVSPPPRQRLDSIDFLRGLVMVIMALDHTRDFFTNQQIDPTDLSKTYSALFLTRWITHFCAPVFAFLVGIGAYLYGSRGRTTAELSRFLWTRGLWLVFLEFTWVRFSLLFNLNYSVTLGIVFWSLGLSMVVLSALVWLRPSVVFAIGMAIICLHNLTDNFHSTNWLWIVLHEPKLLKLSATRVFMPQYPLLPWIGIVATGYGFGSVFLLEPARRRKLLLQAGLIATAAFLVIRAANFYGDPSKWTGGFLSFLNTTKYPPSLLFTLMTLGPALILLSFVKDQITGFGRPFVTFGRVPLFYFVVHLPLLHAAAFLWSLIHPDGKFGLTGVYLIWIAAVLILYPFCKWFDGVKRRHQKQAWVSYV
jgi:uncharacterized membrane protein